MLERHDTVPHSVYLVADNLDAALAAGEDLMAAAGHWAVGDCSDPGVLGAQRWAISRFKTHELNLVGRIVQARVHIDELAREAGRFKPLAQLFSATTADLAGRFGELNDEIDNDFETGGTALAWLRSRGLVEEEAATFGDAAAPEIGDGFLVAGLVPLGVCLDLVAEFLDALDVSYDLYPDAPGDVAQGPAMIAEPANAASEAAAAVGEMPSPDVAA